MEQDTLPTGDIASLMAYIGIHFPFTQDHYPNEDLSTPEKVTRFALEHSLDHMVKTTGKIATQKEDFAHGGDMDSHRLQIDTIKMLVTSLNLARALGMTADDVTRMVPIAMGTQKA